MITIEQATQLHDLINKCVEVEREAEQERIFKGAYSQVEVADLNERVRAARTALAVFIHRTTQDAP